MSEAVFSLWAIRILVGGLIVLMIYIVLNLAKSSQAGRYGTWVLLLALILGVVGFCVKAGLEWMLDTGRS